MEGYKPLVVTATEEVEAPRHSGHRLTKPITRRYYARISRSIKAPSFPASNGRSYLYYVSRLRLSLVHSVANVLQSRLPRYSASKALGSVALRFSDRHNLS